MAILASGPGPFQIPRRNSFYVCLLMHVKGNGNENEIDQDWEPRQGRTISSLQFRPEL